MHPLLADSPLKDILDIAPPYFYLSFWTSWGFFGIIAIFLTFLSLIGVAIWFLVQKRRDPMQEMYRVALAKLEKAKSLLNEDEPEPYARAVSEAVRSYISSRFGYPVPRFTTEEFLAMMEQGGDNPLSPHAGLLREFLTVCDQLKFAKYRPGLPELNALHASALKFVLATRPDFKDRQLPAAQSIPRKAFTV